MMPILSLAVVFFLWLYISNAMKASNTFLPAHVQYLTFCSREKLKQL